MTFCYVYSTGPVENSVGISQPGVAATAFVKALNNSRFKRAKVVIKLYRLNGVKTLVATRTLSLAALASGYTDLNVANLFQYEIQITTFSKKVLVSVWGKNAKGVPLASQRFTQPELNKIVKKHCKK